MCERELKVWVSVAVYSVLCLKDCGCLCLCMLVVGLSLSRGLGKCCWHLSTHRKTLPLCGQSGGILREARSQTALPGLRAAQMQDFQKSDGLRKTQAMVFLLLGLSRKLK